MRKILLIFSLVFALAAPARADEIAKSLVPFNVWQISDIVAIQKLGPHWDQGLTAGCGRTLARNIACHTVAYTLIRSFEKPSKGTILANYLVAVGLFLYTREAEIRILF
jgi:hypothetical protein